jgi:pSer/pThr/pTyr-binding forkhead associated (FHA) protein
MAKLVVVTGPRKGTEFALGDQRFIIGRDPECNLEIPDRLASRKHVLVVKVGDCWMVEDLRSSNGTLFNTKPLDRSVLTDGDEIAIGTTVIRFDATGTVAAEPAAAGSDPDLGRRPTVRQPKPPPPA